MLQKAKRALRASRCSIENHFIELQVIFLLLYYFDGTVVTTKMNLSSPPGSHRTPLQGMFYNQNRFKSITFRITQILREHSGVCGLRGGKRAILPSFVAMDTAV